MNRPVFLGALALLAALAAYNAVYFFPATVDDAFISLRYAWNLAHGQGLVFNPGERVEGFSNPTWTVLAAGFFAAGWEALTALKWTGVALSALTAAATARLALSAGLGRPWALVAAALVAVDLNVAFWAPNGLETPLWTLLLVAYVDALTRRWTTGGAGAESAVLGLLLYATRPEAPLFLAPALLVEAARRRFGWVAAVGGGVAAMLAVRRAYYGDWVANTWYVKAADGWRLEAFPEYLGSWLGVSSPVTGALLVLGAPLLVGERRAWPVLGALAIQFVFVARAGGDWMAQNRFWAPAVPLAAVIVAGAVARAAAASGRWRPAVLGLAATLLGAQAWRHLTHELLYTHPDQHRAFAAKRWPSGPKPISARWQGSYQTGVPDRVVQILRHVPEGQSVAHSEIGLLGFVMENPIVDGFALCDRRLSGATGEPLDEVIATMEPPDWMLLRTQVPILAAMTEGPWYAERGFREVQRWGNVWLEAPAGVDGAPLPAEAQWARLTEAVRRVPRELAFHQARIEVATELGPDRRAEACADLAAALPTLAHLCGGGGAAPGPVAPDAPLPPAQTPNLGFEQAGDGRPVDWTPVPGDATEWGLVPEGDGQALEVRGAFWVCAPWAPVRGDLTVWGRVRAAGVTATGNPRQGAAVSLRLKRADGTQEYPTLQAWSGEVPWTDFRARFPAGDFVEFRACVGINGASGAATFDDVAAGSGS